MSLTCVLYLSVFGPLISFSSCTYSSCFSLQVHDAFLLQLFHFSVASSSTSIAPLSSTSFFFETASILVGHGVTLTVFLLGPPRSVSLSCSCFLSTDSVALLLGPTLPRNLQLVLLRPTPNVSPAGSLTEFEYLDGVVPDAAAPSFSDVASEHFRKTRIEASTLPSCVERQRACFDNLPHLCMLGRSLVPIVSAGSSLPCVASSDLLLSAAGSCLSNLRLMLMFLCPCLACCS